jgi:hypothetical protein
MLMTREYKPGKRRAHSTDTGLILQPGLQEMVQMYCWHASGVLEKVMAPTEPSGAAEEGV